MIDKTLEIIVFALAILAVLPGLIFVLISTAKSLLESHSAPSKKNEKFYLYVINIQMICHRIFLLSVTSAFFIVIIRIILNEYE